MKSLIAVQDTYPEDFAHCYGCGARNRDGYQIKTYASEDNTVTDYQPAAIYTGAGRFAYGGIIASLVDCHSTGSAAILWMSDHGRQVGDGPAPRFVTARLEVDFVAPTPLARWHLTGRAVEIGERKVIVATELQVDGATTVRGRAVLVMVPGF